MEFSPSITEKTKRMLESLKKNSELQQLIAMTENNEGQPITTILESTQENYEKNKEYYMNCLLD